MEKFAFDTYLGAAEGSKNFSDTVAMGKQTLAKQTFYFQPDILHECSVLHSYTLSQYMVPAPLKTITLQQPPVLVFQGQIASWIFHEKK